MMKWCRRTVVAAALLFSFDVSADWLWWTLDFQDSWYNVGELEANPAGEGATGYDVYLVVKDSESGSWVETVHGGTLTDDWLGYDPIQMDVSDFSSDEYLFFVEMVKSSESATETRYLSNDYTYADLVAGGYVSQTLGGFDIVWNPAVGGGWHVPEPSGGLLSLLGFGVLMLRRRRRACA